MGCNTCMPLYHVSIPVGQCQLGFCLHIVGIASRHMLKAFKAAPQQQPLLQDKTTPVMGGWSCQARHAVEQLFTSGDPACCRWTVRQVAKQAFCDFATGPLQDVLVNHRLFRAGKAGSYSYWGPASWGPAKKSLEGNRPPPLAKWIKWGHPAHTPPQGPQAIEKGRVKAGEAGKEDNKGGDLDKEGQRQQSGERDVGKKGEAKGRKGRGMRDKEGD
eukprot:365809-Chlamydomonas_euryale.AAC.4